jgi:hypothetical protein
MNLKAAPPLECCLSTPIDGKKELESLETEMIFFG